MAYGPSAIGAAAFISVKLIGYSLAGRQLNKWYAASAQPIVFGISRTCLGIAAGMGLLYLLMGVVNQDEGMFYLILVPVRFAEWFLILYLFYERKAFSLRRITKYSVLGIIYSFALDIPALISAFVIPGGFWVC